jgi:bacillithiol biosynthesis cysteine-adding enzyme BshC
MRSGARERCGAPHVAQACSNLSSRMQMSIDLRRFPGTGRLAADYAYNFDALAPFFAGNPDRREDWVHAVRQAQTHPRRRGDLVAVISAQQRWRGSPEAARQAANRLSDPRAVAIVTGQQAGLFGGPMFTLLKALTAVMLADRVSREHDVPAVPVFWVEAEDHDWDEVRTCTVFSGQFEALTLGLAARSDDSVPVARVALEPSIAATIDELAQALPVTEFSDDLVRHIRLAYTPGVGMAEAFSRWLDHLMGDRGLIVYDASDPASKPLAAGIFTRELSVPGQTSKLAAAAGSQLAALGYHAQVRTPEEGLALFRLDGVRRPIRRQNGALAIGDDVHSAEALAREAAERPAGFSPGVLLRPIVQDALFPTACYVAGPSELAYLGQLRDVYRHFDVPMPLIYPRASATLLDAGSLRFLNKYQVPLEALQRQDEAALNALLQAQIPAAVEEAFAGVSSALDSHMGSLIRSIPAVDPTLEGAAQSTLGRMKNDLGTLHGKLIQAAKRRDETLRRQFLRARACAFPRGHAQERTIAFVSFLNQYGPALIDRLCDSLPLERGSHWAVAI